MLAIMVAFCLTVPRHWRKPADAARGVKTLPPLSNVEETGVRQPHTCPVPVGEGVLFEFLTAHQWPERSALASSFYIADGQRQPVAFGFANLHGAAPPNTVVGDEGLFSLSPAPTIDELVAERLSALDFESSWIGRTASEPALAANSPAIGEEATGVSIDELVTTAEPLLSTTFAPIGRALVAYVPAEMLPRLTAQAVRMYQLWSIWPVSTSEEIKLGAKSTLRFVEQYGSVATLPLGMEQTPVIVPDKGFDLGSGIDPWCVPQVLFEQLQRVARHEHSREWAEWTLSNLYVLTERSTLDGEDVQSVMANLGDAAQEAMRLADRTDDARLRVELLRAHWALARRLDRWSVAHEIRVAARAADRVAARGSLGTYFEGSPDRLDTPTDQLTLQLEAYEESRDPQLGRQIVSKKRDLESSDDGLERALADAVEQHYRNANVRVAITADMLNRYIDQERSESRPLRDRIGGASIRGQTQFQSTSRVTLEPAVGRWDLDVQSQGTVRSSALADGGQAQFRSQTSTDFSARKRVVVGATGVVLQPASIDVDSHNRLMGVTTDADWLPLFATYARDRAVREYRARQHRAKMEVESKVAAEAVSAIDRETQDAVARVEKQIRERLTDRLAKFGVEVTPIELTTTHERVVARLRVASDEQPGSHTPRPRALSDSLASAQIHETALTNAAVSLELDGKRYTATELVELFQKKFPQAEMPTLDEDKRNTVFHFAKQNAVRFHIENGQLEVTLSLASVELDGRRMRNFVVHAFYTPAVNGLEAELVRDGSLGIEGRLGAAQRARLHNVFNSVLPPERRLPIVKLDDKNDPRLAGLMITQLVLEDGWMGLAVGPTTSERVAERSRSLR
jgi:hypothetical protein